MTRLRQDPPEDPFFAWLARNPEAALLHAGKQCAFHPEHGLLAVGRSLDAVFDVLGERSKIDGLMFEVFPSNVVWITPWPVNSQEPAP